MWTPCTPILDEPVMILYWEFRDFQLIFMSPFLLSWVIGPWLGFGSAFVVAWWMYHIKRGKPAGALWHLLHSWEWFILPGMTLPGVLPPTPQRYGIW